MKEIVNRLQENRQIERAKIILESNGYDVSKETRMKKFYYAPSNTAYVEVSEEDYNKLTSMIDYNAELVEEYEDLSVYEIAEIDEKFAENEKQIQKILGMTDDQFNNTILY